MIRDFLQHLVWEVRILQYQSTRDNPSIPNPELMDQLERFQQRRRCIGLLADEDITQDDLDERQYARTILFAHHRRGTAANDWMEHLEALTELFAEAIFCAEHPENRMTRILSARTLYNQLSAEQDGDNESKEGEA